MIYATSRKTAKTMNHKPSGIKLIGFPDTKSCIIAKAKITLAKSLKVLAKSCRRVLVNRSFDINVIYLQSTDRSRENLFQSLVRNTNG